ncbi:hypothetical protein AAG570_009581 [Ranatra chinensis]|uniref:Integrase catalytic domain-containing protein n=1 Tax=Ranatra chinensis TaxID=642074 RepID=A0ABD0YPH8_9HEMI
MMTKMVAEELARCEVCARAKYVRIPQETPQMVTPTPEKSLDVVEADLVFLGGAIRLTLIDRLTRFAYNYPLQAKTGKRVREGLLLFLATVDTPRTLVLDRGRELDNFLVRSLLEEFRVKVHWTTPGPSRSHRMIERLHGTLQEQLQRGMTGEEAWARALLAYNSSLHSATGYTPLELMRAWQREDSPVSIEYVCGELVDQDERKKRDRVDRLNIKAADRWNRVQAGDYVFVKKWYRRRKTDPRFVGPYIVDTKLPRFRLKVKCVETGRVRVIHANESRPPRARNVRRVLDWEDWILSILDFLAEPYNSIPYVHAGLRIML